jgi:hypothetical protein
MSLDVTIVAAILPLDVEVLKFNLAVLLAHPKLTLRHVVAPTIFRLARTQKNWKRGSREMGVAFRPAVKGGVQDLVVTFSWALGDLHPPERYNEFREELRKLRETMNDNQITEFAALGVAFGLITVLLPEEQVTRVVQVGGRGDYYLNQSRQEMIEISGVKEGDISARFSQKRKQILKNQELRKALVSVTGFAPSAARLERVR